MYMINSAEEAFMCWVFIHCLQFSLSWTQLRTSDKNDLNSERTIWMVAALMHSIWFRVCFSARLKIIFFSELWLICYCYRKICYWAKHYFGCWGVPGSPHGKIKKVFVLPDSLKVLVILWLGSRLFSLQDWYFHSTRIFKIYFFWNYHLFVAGPRRICLLALGSSGINFIIRLLHCSSQQNLNAIDSQSDY